jgi:hypothetical protein
MNKLYQRAIFILGLTVSLRGAIEAHQTLVLAQWREKSRGCPGPFSGSMASASHNLYVIHEMGKLA